MDRKIIRKDQFFEKVRSDLECQKMTLRDWFAGMALAEVPDPATEADAPTTARLCYAIADAMLAERKAK